MPNLTDDDLRALATVLTRRVPAHTPEWTDLNSGDPGVALLAIMAFLTESLLSRNGDLSPRARSYVSKILHRLNAVGEAHPMAGVLTRPRYFDGQLLNADDFTAEQEYQRARRRLHARTLHGVGIVSGLEVTANVDTDSGARGISVEPGVALSPLGDELIVGNRQVVDVSCGSEVCLICLRLVEQAVEPRPVPGGGIEASRIEEGVAVSVETEAPAGAVIIARLERAGETNVWQIDSTFAPVRAIRG